MVVLAVHPRLVGDGGGREQCEQLAGEVGSPREARREHRRRVVGLASRQVGGRRERAVVHRAVAQAGDRHVGKRDAVRRHLGRGVAARGRRVLPGHADGVEQAVVHAEAAGVAHATDHRGADLPPRAEVEDRLQVLGGDDGEHALLALRRHHLDAVHAGLALGHAGEVDVHARAGLGCGLGGRARDAGGAEILHADGEALVEQFETGLDQALLLERVAHLHRGSLRLRTLLEAGRREHAGPTDAVAAGGGPEQHREVALTLGLREHETLHRQHAEAEHVDERVLAVAVVEHDLAAHRGHADRVAVAADAGDHPFEQVAGAGVVEGADAGGRALVGLHGGRVVVALDADRHRKAVADVDHARALTGPDEHPRRLGGEAAEVALGRLVRAVLRPHHRVHGELELGGFPAEQLDDGNQLVVGHTQFAVQTGAEGRGDRGLHGPGPRRERFGAHDVRSLAGIMF